MASDEHGQLVIRAVHVLLHEQDAAAKREADEWLLHFQQTPEAWQVADSLLRAPLDGAAATAEEVHYLAAQTLRTKMRCDFAQLPPSTHADLRDSLLAHLTARAEGPQTVLTQLCLALASLAVHMREWAEPIRDVYARLSADPRSVRALLEWLTVLPEQAMDPKLSVAPARRHEVCAQLARGANEVFGLLVALLAQPAAAAGGGGAAAAGGADAAAAGAAAPSSARREKLLRCFLSWLRLCTVSLARAADEDTAAHALLNGAAAEHAAGGGALTSTLRAQVVASVMRVAEPLVRAATDELFRPDDECFEVAVDVTIELVRFLTGDGSGGRADDGGYGGAGAGADGGGSVFSPSLVELLSRQASSLAQLMPLLGQLAPQLAVHIAAEDEDAARGLCRLLAEVGEAHAPLIVRALARVLPTQLAPTAEAAAAAGAQAEALVSWLLHATAHPLGEIAEIGFNFWYVAMLEIVERLRDDLVGSGRGGGGGGGGGAGGAEAEGGGGGARDFEALSSSVHGAWTPTFLALASALTRALALPADSDSWSADALDDFRRFRYACGDGLSDAAKVCGGDVVLRAVAEALYAGMGKLPASWREVDGALYAAKSLAPFCSNADDEPVASVLGMVARLPPVAGAAAQGGAEPSAAPGAAACATMQHTATLCVSGYAPWLNRHPDHLGPMLTHVAAGLTCGDARVAPAACVAIKSICDACCEHLAAEPWASQLLHLAVASRELSLSPADRSELLQGCGYVYALLPVDSVISYLEALATPLLNRLSQLCADAAPSPHSSEVCSLLDQLASLVRYCQPAVPELAPFHPIAAVLSAAWPVLQSVHARLPADSRAMEKLCRVVKFSVRTATTHTAALMIGLLAELAAWFGANAHSCFLYAVHVCASTLAGHAPDLDDAIFAAYAHMAERALALVGPAAADPRPPPAAPAAGRSAATTGLDAYPDVLEDLLELTVVMLARFPDRLLAWAQWPALVQLGSACVLLQHKEAWRAAMHFSERLLGARATRVEMVPETRRTLEATIEACGPALARQLLLALAGVLPGARCVQLGSALRQMLECAPDGAGAWLQAAAAQLPPAAHEDARALLDALGAHSPPSGPAVRRAVDAFSESCRRKRVLEGVS